MLVNKRKILFFGVRYHNRSPFRTVFENWTFKTKTHPLYNRIEKIFNGNKENGLKERWVFEIELGAIRNV